MLRAYPADYERHEVRRANIHRDHVDKSHPGRKTDIAGRAKRESQVFFGDRSHSAAAGHVVGLIRRFDIAGGQAQVARAMGLPVCTETSLTAARTDSVHLARVTDRSPPHR